MYFFYIFKIAYQMSNMLFTILTPLMNYIDMFNFTSSIVHFDNGPTESCTTCSSSDLEAVPQLYTGPILHPHAVSIQLSDSEGQ